jgi:predicted PurR-regulated permease PerM
MNVLIVASAAALTALITYLMVVGGPILLPLVIAVLAWYLINALTAASRAIRIGGKTPPAGLRLSAAIIIILLLSWFVVDLIVANVGHVVARAPLHEHNLREVTDRTAAWLGAEELTAVHSLFDKGRLTSMIRNAADGLMSVVASIGTVAVYVVFLIQFDTLRPFVETAVALAVVQFTVGSILEPRRSFQSHLSRHYLGLAIRAA